MTGRKTLSLYSAASILALVLSIAPLASARSYSASLATDGICTFTSVIQWSDVRAEAASHSLRVTYATGASHYAGDFTEFFSSAVRDGSSTHTFVVSKNTTLSGNWHVMATLHRLPPAERTGGPHAGVRTIAAKFESNIVQATCPAAI